MFARSDLILDCTRGDRSIGCDAMEPRGSHVTLAAVFFALVCVAMPCPMPLVERQFLLARAVYGSAFSLHEQHQRLWRHHNCKTGCDTVCEIVSNCIKSYQIASNCVLFRVAHPKNACLCQSLQRACAAVELVIAEFPPLMRAVGRRLHATITRACCSSHSTSAITRLPVSCAVRFYLQVGAVWCLVGARV
jgi:hypothetical protein